MDNQKQEEDRWRELHELLGIPGDSAPPAKQETRPPAPEPRAIKAYEEPRPAPEPTIRFEEEVGRLEPIHEEQEPPTIPIPITMHDEPAGDWEEEFEEDRDDTPLEAPGSSPAEELESAAEEGPAGEPPVAGEEDKPRRGRRRRRRGRRRGGDRPEGEGQETRAPAGEAGPRPSAAPRPPRDAEPDRRGRGRGRGRGRDDADQRRPEPAPRQERAQPAPMEADDADDFREEQQPATDAPRHGTPQSDTDFSDWNVPSWQDLISSLYRPDR